MDSKDFLGCGLKFPLQIDKKTGHIALVNYETDISESIGIILNTYLGERIMRPDFGSSIQDYVFQPRTVIQDGVINKILEKTLTIFEPRIKDVECKLDTDNADPDSGNIVFNITYVVRTTNNRYNKVYPFYMTEGNKKENIV